MVERLEYPDDADESTLRDQLDELTDEPGLDQALLQQAQIEMRESPIDSPVAPS